MVGYIWKRARRLWEGEGRFQEIFHVAIASGWAVGVKKLKSEEGGGRKKEGRRKEGGRRREEGRSRRLPFILVRFMKPSQYRNFFRRDFSLSLLQSFFCDKFHVLKFSN
jgi:hypothetical protein